MVKLQHPLVRSKVGAVQHGEGNAVWRPHINPPVSEGGPQRKPEDSLSGAVVTGHRVMGTN